MKVLITNNPDLRALYHDTTHLMCDMYIPLKSGRLQMLNHFSLQDHPQRMNSYILCNPGSEITCSLL